MPLLGILCWLGLLWLPLGMLAAPELALATPAQAQPIRIAAPANLGSACPADRHPPIDRPASPRPPAVWSGGATGASGDDPAAAVSRPGGPPSGEIAIAVLAVDHAMATADRLATPGSPPRRDGRFQPTPRRLAGLDRAGNRRRSLTL